MGPRVKHTRTHQNKPKYTKSCSSSKLLHAPHQHNSKTHNSRAQQYNTSQHNTSTQAITAAVPKPRGTRMYTHSGKEVAHMQASYGRAAREESKRKRRKRKLLVENMSLASSAKDKIPIGAGDCIGHTTKCYKLSIRFHKLGTEEK